MKSGYSGMTKSESREWKNNHKYNEMLEFDMIEEKEQEETIQETYNLVFLTGAGISKDSGIPTFDEVDGLRDKLSRTYANLHKEDYAKTINDFTNMIANKEPNTAHLAIAQLNVPILTMNIDGLHQKAGSTRVTELHGSLPEIVLYGDNAPMYDVAYDIVKNLKYNDSYFIIVGTSFTTNVSSELLRLAKQRKAKILIINDNASVRVPKVVNNLNDKLML